MYKELFEKLSQWANHQWLCFYLNTFVLYKNNKEFLKFFKTDEHVRKWNLVSKRLYLSWALLCLVKMELPDKVAWLVQPCRWPWRFAPGVQRAQGKSVHCGPGSHTPVPLHMLCEVDPQPRYNGISVEYTHSHTQDTEQLMWPHEKAKTWKACNTCMLILAETSFCLALFYNLFLLFFFFKESYEHTVFCV